MSCMDASTFGLLCEASQLSFKDGEKESFMRELDSLIEFAGAVRKHDCVYDDAGDADCVTINDLREDNTGEPFPTEKLLENTESLFDCYIIPKLME